MKIYFEVPFHSTAWGGGNQFLKYLIKNLRSLNFITTNPEKLISFSLIVIIV